MQTISPAERNIIGDPESCRVRRGDQQAIEMASFCIPNQCLRPHLNLTLMDSASARRDGSHRKVRLNLSDLSFQKGHCSRGGRYRFS